MNAERNGYFRELFKRNKMAADASMAVSQDVVNDQPVSHRPSTSASAAMPISTSLTLRLIRQCAAVVGFDDDRQSVGDTNDSSIKR
jgi:hypothetical protein